MILCTKTNDKKLHSGQTFPSVPPPGFFLSNVCNVNLVECSRAWRTLLDFFLYSRADEHYSSTSLRLVVKISTCAQQCSSTWNLVSDLYLRSAGNAINDTAKIHPLGFLQQQQRFGRQSQWVKSLRFPGNVHRPPQRLTVVVCIGCPNKKDETTVLKVA